MCFIFAGLISFNLRECDKLECASNFIPWKCNLQMFLEEAEIWDHVVKEITTPTNLKLLVGHIKEEAKQKRLILDLVKDRLIAHIAKKIIEKLMYGVLVGLYQIFNVSTHMLLRNKHSIICMSNTYTVVSYLVRVTELIDQLDATRTNVEDKELAFITLIRGVLFSGAKGSRRPNSCWDGDEGKQETIQG